MWRNQIWPDFLLTHIQCNFMVFSSVVWGVFKGNLWIREARQVSCEVVSGSGTCLEPRGVGFPRTWISPQNSSGFFYHFPRTWITPQNSLGLFVNNDHFPRSWITLQKSPGFLSFSKNIDFSINSSRYCSIIKRWESKMQCRIGWQRDIITS